MNHRMYTVAALTAAIALSASFVIFRAGADQSTRAPAHVASAGATHLVTGSAQAANAQMSQYITPVADVGTPGLGHGVPSLAPQPTSAAAPSAATPTLVTVQGGSRILAAGAQHATPVTIDESQAMLATFKGGMWLPNTTGGREYAQYDHHLIHDDGDWTWVGKVQTSHGPQSAVITFGKKAVFGRIPQASGQPLRIVTADGQELMVQTDGVKMAASAENRQLYARQDFKVPRHKAAGSHTHAAAASSPVSSAAATTSSATATSGTTIDVMVAFTNGFAGAQGSSSAALTRINNLVDVTNQAYSDSGVNEQIRLVHTMEVNYTDTNDNTTALDALTGNDGNGSAVPIPTALQGIASARTQYGADLVVLLRKFNNASNNGCGVGWLIGGDQQQIIPSEDNAFGYSVVQDGVDGGFFCLDTTFAHELGHNMGSAHDRANADQPGAYSYSYGYLGNGTNGFGTIMAYTSDTQTPLNLFSNPNISKCQNLPCGVSDSSTSSADNAHSLNNTSSLIAQFEATKVALPSNSGAVNDINGDGTTDLLWSSNTGFAYWLMSGSTTLSGGSYSRNGLTLSATGDFNGDGRLDLIWTNGSAIYAWMSTGSSYQTELVGYYDGSNWKLVGAADMNGDGSPDFLWHSRTTSRFTYWVMKGLKASGGPVFPISSAYRFVASGDFNGDGKLDIVWTNGSAVYVWLGNGGFQFTSRLVGNYGTGWVLKGIGDIDGDGSPDLLFHNQKGASFAYWILRNCVPVKSAAFPVGSQYSIGAIGDFNGDGKTDVMWTDGAALYEWTGSGSSFASHYVANYGSGWSLIQMGEPQ